MFGRVIASLAALAVAVTALGQLRAITYVSGLNNPMYMVQNPTLPDT